MCKMLQYMEGKEKEGKKEGRKEGRKDRRERNKDRKKGPSKYEFGLQAGSFLQWLGLFQAPAHRTCLLPMWLTRLLGNTLVMVPAMPNLPF